MKVNYEVERDDLTELLLCVKPANLKGVAGVMCHNLYSTIYLYALGYIHLNQRSTNYDNMLNISFLHAYRKGSTGTKLGTRDCVREKTSEGSLICHLPGLEQKSLKCSSYHHHNYSATAIMYNLKSKLSMKGKCRSNISYSFQSGKFRHLCMKIDRGNHGSIKF